MSVPACALPAVLAALSGEAPAPHPAALVAPAGVGLRSAVRPAPPDAKPIYGGPIGPHIDTANFTVQWVEGQATEAQGQAAAEALEEAWAALVEEGGWPRPVSADTYLLWVILDPGLSGTGFTTVYFTEEYPGGYPVMYLNPTWADNGDFWASLSAHEFAHAIQFGMRAWAGTGAEGWYWEASAEWAAERSVPDRNTYAWSSEWFASQPHLRYDSFENYHQYGMFFVNAYAEEALDPEAMRGAWEAGAAAPGADWAGLLGGVVGAEPEALWASAAAAYAAGGLRESGMYAPLVEQGELAEGAAGVLPRLGVHAYAPAAAAVRVEAEGAVWLGAPGGVGPVVELGAGERLVVVGAADDAAYTLRVGPPGGGDGGGGDGGDAGTDTAGGDGQAGVGGDEKGGGAACASVGGAAGALWALGALALSGRRRRSAR